MRSIFRGIRTAAAAIPFVAAAACTDAKAAAVFPEPTLGTAVAATAAVDTAVFAGGCFWGVEAVYRHVKGVISATSGFAGGDAATAHYDMVSGGDTGHAESVRVIFDPSRVSYGTLLKVFFSVAHDPTELNRQGPDEGTQYRSAIFFANADQQRVAASYIAELTAAKTFRRQIVTQVVPLKAFYPAEDYHQNYAALHPDNPYIAINDAPKVVHLKRQFAELYHE